MKPSYAKIAVQTCLRANVAGVLTGAPGGGKTDVVKEAVTEDGYELLLSHPVIKDPVDYAGLPFANAERTAAEFLPYGDLKVLIDAEKPTVCFIDDVGQALVTVQGALMQLIQERCVNGRKISDKVRYILATNRETDRAGVQRMITPLANRAIHIPFDTDFNDWRTWAIHSKLYKTVISFIAFKPNLLHVFDPKRAEKAFPSPRSWHIVSKLLAAGLNPDIEFEMIAGTVGEGAAGEFVAYMKVERELPNIDAILLNPRSWKPPKDRPDVLYSVCGSLVERASEQNIGRVCEVIDKFPPEFGVLTIRDALTKEPNLANTTPMIEWFAKNTDVLV